MIGLYPSFCSTSALRATVRHSSGAQPFLRNTLAASRRPSWRYDRMPVLSRKCPNQRTAPVAPRMRCARIRPSFIRSERHICGRLRDPDPPRASPGSSCPPAPSPRRAPRGQGAAGVSSPPHPCVLRGERIPGTGSGAAPGVHLMVPDLSIPPQDSSRSGSLDSILSFRGELLVQRARTASAPRERFRGPRVP